MNKYHIGQNNNHQYDHFTELEVQMSWSAFLNKSIMFYFIIYYNGEFPRMHVQTPLEDSLSSNIIIPYLVMQLSNAYVLC